jgi:preprotein translocase subunit YajC
VQTHGEGGKVTTVQTATRAWGLALLIAGGVWTMGGCTPKVEVVPSDKPITINLNVKIDHEIRIKIEKELQEALSEKNGLF